MKISHIEHIGIAVPDLAKAIEYYETVLGLKCYKQEVVEDQKVTTAFFKVGDTKIELLEATSPDSTIATVAAAACTTWLSLLKTVLPMLLPRLKKKA